MSADDTTPSGQGAREVRLTWRDHVAIWAESVYAHLRRCPTCGRRPRRWSTTPRWDQDPVARMLGLPVVGHCGDCGKEAPLAGTGGAGRADCGSYEAESTATITMANGRHNWRADRAQEER